MWHKETQLYESGPFYTARGQRSPKTGPVSQRSKRHSHLARSQQSPYGAKPPSHRFLSSRSYSGRFELAFSSPFLFMEAFSTPTHFTTSVHFKSFFLFTSFVKIISLQVFQSFFEDSQRHKGTPSLLYSWLFQGGSWEQDLWVPVGSWPPASRCAGAGLQVYMGLSWHCWLIQDT